MEPDIPCRTRIGEKGLEEHFIKIKPQFEAEGHDLPNAQEPFEFAPVAQLSLDGSGAILQANYMAHQMFGVAPSGLPGCRLADYVAPDLLEEFLFHLKQVRDNAAVHGCELELRRQDGAPLFVQIESVHVPQNGCIRTAMIDITARHRAEMQVAQATVHLAQLTSDLSAQKELLEAIMENTGAMIAYLDRDFRYVKLNSVFERGCGLTSQELLGENHFEVFSQAGYRGVFEQVRGSGHGVRFEAMPFSFMEDTQGRIYWDWALFPVVDDSGRVEGMVLSLIDVTERQKARESVQNALAYAEDIVNTVRIPLVILDSELRIISASDAFYKQFEMAPVDTRQRFFHELRDGEWDLPELRTKLQSVVDFGTTISDFEMESASETHGKRYLVLNARRLRSKPSEGSQVLIEIEDITERKATQQRLIAYERLAALGELSGNIAHEVRNPLATIDSSVFFLKRKLADADDKVKVHLDRIKSSVDRSGRIITSLLNLTRMKEPQIAYADLRKLVGEAVSVEDLPKGIQVVLELPEDAAIVQVDGEQIGMALDNIIKNAVEAMGTKGTLTVQLNIDSDWAELRIIDTGHGILPENLEKVFLPLFTTKAAGIGFGLSTAKMIVGKHGGTMVMMSQAGGPTTSIVRLPCGK